MGDENSDDDAFESADEDEFPAPIREMKRGQPRSGKNDESNLSPSLLEDLRIDGIEKLAGSKSTGSIDRPAAGSPIVGDPAEAVHLSSSTGETGIDTPVFARATFDIPAAAAVSSATPAAAPAAEASWSSWSSWGASLLSTASKSVSQFSTEVSEGLNVLVDVSINDVDADDVDAETEKIAQQAKESPIIASQPLVDIPPLSSGQLPPQDAQCPTSEDVKTFAPTPPCDASSSALPSLASGFFSSASASGLSSAFVGNFPSSSLPSFSSLSTALSASSSAASSAASAASSAAASALTSPTAAAASGKLAGLMGGGLEVLEMVGRKTMDVLKETDSGVEETTRALFDDRKGRKTLSELLREGKTKCEGEEGEREEWDERRKNSFGYWFEEFKGMAHLEALELLSARCETDLKDALGGIPPNSINPKLAAIKDLFKDDDDDDDDDNDNDDDEVDPRNLVFSKERERKLRQLVRQHVERFHLSTAVREVTAPTTAALTAADHFVDAVKDAWRKVEEMEKNDGKVAEEEDENKEEEGKEGEEVKDDHEDKKALLVKPPPPPTPADVHRACIRSLADLVAKNIQLYHKIGQMTLVPPFQSQSPTESSIDSFEARSTHLVVLSKMTVGNTNTVATVYGQLLSKFEGRHSEIEINQKMTDIFLEASQGTDHVKSAFKLLLPVLQFRFLNESQGS